MSKFQYRLWTTLQNIAFLGFLWALSPYRTIPLPVSDELAFRILMIWYAIGSGLGIIIILLTLALKER